MLRDELANAFEAEETGVAFVGVKHLQRNADRLQGAHAADTQQDFLADAVLFTTAVEAIGDGPAIGVVVVDVGIHQVERDAPNLCSPDSGGDDRSGKVDRDLGLFAAGGLARRNSRRHRHECRIEHRILLDLEALRVEPLTEVSLPIKQTHAGERNA